MSEQLKPCPFCGGESEVNEIDGDYMPSCTVCDANVGYFESEQEAFSAWNKRMESKRIAGKG